SRGAHGSGDYDARGVSGGRRPVPGSGRLRRPAGSAALREAATEPGGSAPAGSAAGPTGPAAGERRPRPPPVRDEGPFPQGPLAPLPAAPRPQAAGALPAGALPAGALPAGALPAGALPAGALRAPLPVIFGQLSPCRTCLTRIPSRRNRPCRARTGGT